MNKLDSRVVGLLTVLLIAFGLVLVVILVNKPTQLNQQASGVTNINTGSQITTANNNDGTMGPKDFSKNYSNTLSKNNLGSLTFSVTDPVQSSFPTGLPSPTVSQNTQVLGSLIIKFKKIEVHLSSYGKNTAAQKLVDKWETLNMPVPMSVDLIQLIGGGIANLGLTSLAAGTYTEVRLYVQSVQAVIENGQTVNVHILRNDSVVRIVQNFTVNAGRNTNLIIDFDAKHSLLQSNNSYSLKPFVTKLLENH